VAQTITHSRWPKDGSASKNSLKQWGAITLFRTELALSPEGPTVSSLARRTQALTVKTSAPNQVRAPFPGHLSTPSATCARGPRLPSLQISPLRPNPKRSAHERHP
jgi:hypothetical protein